MSTSTTLKAKAFRGPEIKTLLAMRRDQNILKGRDGPDESKPTSPNFLDQRSQSLFTLHSPGLEREI